MIGLPIYLVSKLKDKFGWVLPVAVVFVVIGLVFWHKQHKKKKALRIASPKVNQDEDIVEDFWNGTHLARTKRRTAQRYLGDPVAVDRAVYKTKAKETFGSTYQQSGDNRFGLRVTVEDGCVIGWNKKDNQTFNLEAHIRLI